MLLGATSYTVLVVKNFFIASFITLFRGRQIYTPFLLPKPLSNVAHPTGYTTGLFVYTTLSLNPNFELILMDQRPD